ncbi:MAG: winged helix-turn-helix domain-containing protein [Ktedonobacterales bacterium]
MVATARDEREDERAQDETAREGAPAPLRLSVTEARGLMLAAQGLLEPPAGAPELAHVQATIERLGAVQIDTISVVARSQYLVLWSRLGRYDPALLDALLAPRRAIFEYWSHAASILPMTDFAYYQAEMVHAPEWHLYEGTRRWAEEHPDVVRDTLAAIRERGPLASAAFERPEGAPRTDPWDWYGPKESRVALDVLWLTGELMVHSRRSGQKVYDLRARVLAEAAAAGTVPGGAARAEALPGHEQRLRHFVGRTVRALGVVTPGWLWDYFRLQRYLRVERLPGASASAAEDSAGGPGGAGTGGVGTANAGRARALLEAQVAAGLAVPARIAGLVEPAYVAVERLADLERLRAGAVRPERTTLLSPFDSLIWDRKRTRQLFGYEVVFEAYVAPEKRRFGYYCLAILYRAELVGRLDAKALRDEGALLVRAVYLEPGVVVEDGLLEGLAGALWDLARFQGLAEVRVERTTPPGLARRLTARIARAPGRVRRRR